VNPDYDGDDKTNNETGDETGDETGYETGDDKGGKTAESREAVSSKKTPDTNDDPLPTALTRTYITCIPGVQKFSVWEKISEYKNNSKGLSLKCNVDSLEITSYTFVDEFSPGKLKDMVEFVDEYQISFTLPLAEKYRTNNSWEVANEGGVYILPTFCIDGKSAIYPIR